MELTFLAAANNKPLTKEIKADGTVVAYPLVKRMTSAKESVPLDNNGLRKAASLIQAYSNKGYCLQKGGLKQELNKESRAGKIDRARPSEYIVLDIDGMVLPSPFPSTKLTQQDMAVMAEEIVQQLTIPDFAKASYIVQASASMGRNKNKISMHIFFFLETPLPPASIKILIKYLNASVPLLVGQMGLSENGMALKYVLDPSVTDNSHIIFIAPPEFEDPTMDPFITPVDRMALIIKDQATVNLQNAIATVLPDAINKTVKQRLEKLREKAGLPKKKYKESTVTLNNEVFELITNPDHLLIHIIDDQGYPYIRCNVNHGDSRGYYFDARNPIYMYNFKGEPVWEIAKANPQFIAAISDLAETHGDLLLTPVVLRDFDTNVFFNGLFDKKAARFSEAFPMTPTTKANTKDFMETHGHILPPFIPDAKVVFDPTKGQEKPNLVNPPLYVNTYTETGYMTAAVMPTTAAIYQNACGSLQGHTPMCFRIISHMLGDRREDIEHFLNWLAYIYQHKTKTMTAWILSGTTGTGKGVFVNKILKPLFGHSQVPMRSLENLEEHFNHYLQKAMILVVDEFRVLDASRGGSRSANRLTDKLKQQITEPTLTIRAMRADQIEVPSYVNFIFLTNHYDALRIDPSDRRYNVGTRQEQKLQDTYGADLAWIETLESELYHLAGWLQTFVVNVVAARTCLQNEEKTHMQQAGASLFDEFCTVLRSGQLEYFYDVLDMSPTSIIGSGIITGKRLVLNWLEDVARGIKVSIVPSENLRVLFMLIAEPVPTINSREFSRRLAKQGITPVRKRIGVSANPVRGIEIAWENVTAEQAQEKLISMQPGAQHATHQSVATEDPFQADFTSNTKPVRHAG